MPFSKGITVESVNSIDAGMMREGRSHFDLKFKILRLFCAGPVIYSSRVAMEVPLTHSSLIQWNGSNRCLQMMWMGQQAQVGLFFFSLTVSHKDGLVTQLPVMSPAENIIHTVYTRCEKETTLSTCHPSVMKHVHGSRAGCCGLLLISRYLYST